MNDERGRINQFRSVFHSCCFPMVTVDNHRRYVDANRAAKLVFRLSLDEMRQRRIDHFTSTPDLARLDGLWSHLLGEGEVWGTYDVLFEDRSRLRIAFSALANVLPGEHLIVFAPADWREDELRPLAEPAGSRTRGPLSAREREVLGLIADGLSLAEIADELTISVATVRTHGANLHRKLGARNRAHAVALALRLGMIAPRPRSLEGDDLAT